ncbi:hypothetical protein [Dactylosporangium sp. CS-033363]|uniref:hypothetical protein n=1 Tax=Dactylosporangium sp. CS-033363 TaxID=3239935 RepID=UPI003D8FC973
MTEGWDHIDWAQHDGAFGPAREAPEIFRAIASGGAEAAAEGRFAFYESLHHQGSVYPATVVAVPLLVELAMRPGVHGRDDLLSTIGRLGDPERSYGDVQPEVRAAVAAQSERLRPALDDPDPQVRAAAAYAADAAGAPAAGVADGLAGVARHLATAEDRRAAETAFAALLRVGSPAWREPALTAWAAGYDPVAAELFWDHPPAFDPEALHAIRGRLAAGTDGATPLIRLLHRWGPAAVEAAPEIAAAYCGVAAGALAAIGAHSAVPMLLERAFQGDIRAALAVRDLTGDGGAVPGAVAAHGARRRVDGFDLHLAAAAGPELAPLVPALRAWLAGPDLTDDVRCEVARLLWRATGDPAEALPTARAVLDQRGSSIGFAARLAADLAPDLDGADPGLADGLWAALSGAARWARPIAARGLWQLGVAVGDLVGPLLAGLAEARAEEAVALLVDMRATAAVPVLADLAERDERVPRYGSVSYYGSDVSWHDDALRARLRAAVTALGEP